MQPMRSGLLGAMILAFLAAGAATPAAAHDRGRWDDRRWDDRRGDGRHWDDHRWDDRRGDHWRRAGRGRGDDYWRGGDGPSVRVDIRIGGRDRVIIGDYYRDSFRRGHCPPGLAKKHNGCAPPGLARHWQRGRPLHRDVVYYDLPPDLVIRIGAAPRGYRYARVGADILLLAVGTGLVVDAIEDLARE